MELDKTFDGGLNTDDAYEVMPPDDYHFAANAISGRTSKKNNGLVELKLGTREIDPFQEITLVNPSFTDDLSGWLNNASIEISGSSEISFDGEVDIVGGVREPVSGDAEMALSATAEVVDAADVMIEVNLRSDVGSSSETATVSYRINGGAWTPLATALTIGASYTDIGDIIAGYGDTVEIAVIRTSDSAAIIFGASDSSSGSYSGFVGELYPYGDIYTVSKSVYLRVPLSGGSFTILEES